jgi:hypothetical protein
VTASDDDAPLIVAGYVAMWRQHSGSGHGLRWPLLLRSRPMNVDGQTGVHARITSGGVEELSHAAAQVHMLTRRAFDLHELRRRAHA